MIYLKVNEMLKTRKKTKYWFHKHMGGSYQSITKLMNNETNSIHYKTLDRICDVLDCEPGDIIKRKRNPKRKKDDNDEQTSKAV